MESLAKQGSNSSEQKQLQLEDEGKIGDKNHQC